MQSLHLNSFLALVRVIRKLSCENQPVALSWLWLILDLAFKQKTTARGKHVLE